MEFYKRTKTVKALGTLLKIADKRVQWGRYIVDGFVNPDLPFEKWWIYLDLFKCYLQVFDDPVWYTEFADNVYFALQEDSKSEQIEYFEKIAGIRFDPELNKYQFRMKLVEKFSGKSFFYLFV